MSIRIDDPFFAFYEKYKDFDYLFFLNTDEWVLDFNLFLYEFYSKNRRSFTWRDVISSYNVTVSEIMLQQTQTERVRLKFETFLIKFSDFKSLADASVESVLQEWLGLGYNRRAITLYDFAKKIVYEWNGILPSEPLLLTQQKGIGKNTAASIITFTYNKPLVFIETNIRSVFLHLFFGHKTGLADELLMPLIQKALDLNDPRNWYYALMDYGTIIKKMYKNPNIKSKHYLKQSPFKGSNREIRGAIIKFLTLKKDLSDLSFDKSLIKKNLIDLEREGFLEKYKENYRLKI